MESSVTIEVMITTVMPTNNSYLTTESGQAFAALPRQCSVSLQHGGLIREKESKCYLMSALEYMLLDQLSSKKTYITSYTRISEDDIGGDSNNDSGFSEKKAFVIENEIAKWKKNNFDVTDKSLQILNVSRDAVKKANRKHSASQTDPVDGGDFDWDLTDKFDSETQTRQSSSNWSDDATVQTDQRMVFYNKGKKVSFQSSGLGSSAKSRSASKHSWSQTRLLDNQEDKQCQVKPADLGAVPRNQKWRRNHRRHHNHHHHITRVNIAGPRANKPKVSTKPNNVVSFHLDDDIEGPVLTHKSSLAVHKARLDKNLEMSSHIAVQTDHDPESSVSHHSFKSDLYTEDPAFFHEVDVHVIEEVSLRWYKSIKKLVRHIQEVIETVPEYGDREDLVTVRGIFIWVADNIR